MAAIARIAGKYSGRAPAITALTATFSTSYAQYSRKLVGRIRPMISSGAWLVFFSIASTRSSVGRTIGRIVGPVVLLEHRVEVLLGVDFEEARRGPIERAIAEVLAYRAGG